MNPEFGSNLKEYLGRKNINTNRQLIMLEIENVLRLDARVKEVTANYDPHRGFIVRVLLFSDETIELLIDDYPLEDLETINIID
jgi:phage baseplate assembly protein W